MINKENDVTEPGCWWSLQTQGTGLLDPRHLLGSVTYIHYVPTSIMSNTQAQPENMPWKVTASQNSGSAYIETAYSSFFTKIYFLNCISLQ